MNFLRRRWTEDDLEALKSMAGKYPAAQIAKMLDRGHPASAVKAHQLGISLRMERSPRLFEEPNPAMAPEFT